MQKVLYLDKEGIIEHKKSIENLLINLGRIEEKMNILKENNFDKIEYEELLDLRDNIKERILAKKSQKIIEIEKNNNEDILDINDVVRVKTYFSEIDTEEETYQLVGGLTDYSSDIIKLSINTPLGKVLYKSKVGDTTYYDLNNEKIKVEILEKVPVKSLTKSL